MEDVMNCDEISLIQTSYEVSTSAVTYVVPPKAVRNEDIAKNIKGKNIPKPIQTGGSANKQKGGISDNDEAAEERQRTGRYLAIGVTLIMLFIAFYHTLLRHATVLAGLLAPAIIMLLYILWLFYFARKKKPQVSDV